MDGESTVREERDKAEERIITERNKETNLKPAIASYRSILA